VKAGPREIRRYNAAQHAVSQSIGHADIEELAGDPNEQIRRAAARALEKTEGVQ
jgi:hypothetical protein